MCVAPLGSPGVRLCHSNRNSTAEECEDEPLEEHGPEAKKTSQKQLKLVKDLLSSVEDSLLRRSSECGSALGAPSLPCRVQHHRSLDSPMGPCGESSSSGSLVFSRSAGVGRSKVFR